VSRLELSLFAGRAVDAPADTLVVPVPEDERPLRGDAGWVDWRLCGGLSEQLRTGYASGKLGEAVLLPGGPPLAAARVLMVGIGPAAEITGRPLLQAMRTVTQRLLTLRSSSAVLACPGSIDFEVDGVSLLRGIVHGLAAAEAPAVLKLVLADGLRREKTLLSALSEVVPGAQSWGIAVDVGWIEHASAGEAVAPRA
jgi:hypothetical protein